ncbi:MAG: alpha/beta fold hydrolase [Nitriliruptoraceae bacterium]|nr:alpha/beta fold hydrolase [Nitriliruptoraceae bacterium]
MTSTPPLPETRFAPARGARLAYQVFGSGDQTVVAVPPTAQNIELSWEYPAVRSMLERFGRFCRYLHFDKRGTGCSDRHGHIADLDERVDDLRAVMDDAGIEHAYLFGNSEGGPMSLLFAATYPDRVDGLILFGTGAALLPAGTTADELDARRVRNRAYAARWGTDDSPTAPGMAPSLAAADPAFVPWHRRYERFAASQDSLLELLELGMLADVRDLLPTITQPTLLLHRIDDPVIPIDRARETAAGLPAARLVELDGGDHFSYAGDVDTWMAEFERFVTGHVTPGVPPRPAGSRVRITSLGRFAVEVDGEEVAVAAWGSRRARQLCKRLVVARGWPVTREELFDLLWPGETDRHRLGARLSVQLSGVRRVLSGGVIATRESIRLDLDAVTCDLVDFDRAEDDAAIVAAFHGPLLPDDVGEPWLDGPRAQVQERFALAAHRHLGTLEAAGAQDAALALVTRILTLAPYDEGAHRRHVTILHRAGARREALAAHATYVAAMAELGIEVPAMPTPS